MPVKKLTLILQCKLGKLLVNPSTPDSYINVRSFLRNRLWIGYKKMSLAGSERGLADPAFRDLWFDLHIEPD